MTSTFSWGDNCLPADVTQDVRAGMMRAPPAEWQTYYNDFNTYVAGDWTITVTQAGSGNAAEALTNAAGGVLLITNDNANNDNVFFQATSENWKAASGKRLYFESRFKVSDATKSAVIMGLQITDTTPLAVSDGIWFQKPAAATHLDFHVANSSTQTDVTDLAEMADDTYTTLGFLYDGGSNVYYIKDGTVLGSAASTNISTHTLAISFGIQNGEGVIKTMSLDYIYVASER